MINRLLMRRHTELAIATNNQLQPTHKYCCCYNRADLVQCSVVQELEEICFQLYAQTFRLSSGLIKPVRRTEVRMPPRLGFYWQLKKKFRTPTLPSFLPRLLFLRPRQEAGAGWSTENWEWIIQIVKCTAISRRSQTSVQGRAGQGRGQYPSKSSPSLSRPRSPDNET